MRDINKQVRKMLSLLILPLFLFGCNGAVQNNNNNNDTAEEARRNVGVVEVERRNIASGIRTTARVESDVHVNVNPALGGKIERIHVREGDTVYKDQLLLELEDTQLIQTEKAYRNAEKNYRRMKELLKTESIDQQTFEEVEAAYVTAEKNYEHVLQNTKIRSPINGQVSDIAMKEGESFAPMTLQYLVRLLSLDRMKAVASISDRNYPLVGKHMIAELSVTAYPDKVFRGRVTYVSPEAYLLTGAFRCDIMVYDEERLLRHNQFARILLVVEQAENTLVVPQEAIVEENILFVADDDRARRREVETGVSTPDEIEIIAGVSEGEKVIVKGNVGLSDNYPINVID